MCPTKWALVFFISFHLSISIKCYLVQGLPFVSTDNHPAHHQHHHHHYHERVARSAPLVDETFTADHFDPSPDDENYPPHRTFDEAASSSSHPETSETEDLLPSESSSYYSSSYYPSSYYPSSYSSSYPSSYSSSSYWPSAPAQPRYRYVTRRKSPPSPARYARALMRARGETPPTELASKEPQAVAAATNQTSATSTSTPKPSASASTPTNTSTTTVAPEVTTKKTNNSENDEEHEFYNPKPETVDANESDTEDTGNNYAPVAPVVSSVPVRTNTGSIASRPFYRSDSSYGSQPVRFSDILNPWTSRSSNQPNRFGRWITRTFLEPLLDPSY